MADSLHRIIQASPDTTSQMIPSPNASRRLAAPSLDLLPDTASDLRELIQSGVSQFELLEPEGTLLITNNTQLIRDPHISSDGFCIVNFRRTSGQSFTFEINLRDNVVTVARNDSRVPKHCGFTPRLEYLAYDGVMSLFVCVIRATKLQMASHLPDDVVIDTTSTAGRVKGVLRRGKS